MDVSPEGVAIRRERSADVAGIGDVNAAAFGRGAEAELVQALRDAGALTLSLVAEDRGQIIGHVAFSPVDIDTASGVVAAIGLAPMAVRPERQREGIGTQLVRAGLDALRRDGHGLVVVLGHEAYYPRFGFAPAKRFGLRWEHADEIDAFMALELVVGSAPEGGGVVRYRPELGAA